MKKGILFLGIMCTLISSTGLINQVNALGNTSDIIKAESKKDYKEYCNSLLLDGLGNVKRNEVILINGVENPLYCTFENKTDSLQKIQNKVPKILATIAKRYSLEPINEYNWQSYKDGMFMLLEETEEFGERSEEFRILAAFFDVYEDYDKNQEILDLVNKINLKQKSFNENANDGIELGMLLPYYAPLSKNASRIVSKTSMAKKIHVPSAVTYATNHATNPNKAAYYYFSRGDCTNFTSQILEATGVQQAVYDSEYSGWWHKVTNTGFLGSKEHKHSRSWTMADTFARYMGVGYSTTNHESFSSNLQAGDFIALDKTNNGSWDHMGFVTETGGGVCTSTGNFINYRVAQHTKNYHEWLTSDKNGWELAGADGGKYARVRR
ncbi:MAG TPA: hypothetical protein DCE23_02955 [Firmicutes bacterium]|nr:hypothetical protein [Bacillota bacterium]